MSGDKLQLFVTSGTQGCKRTQIYINKDASIEDLMTKISEWNNISKEEQRVIFAGKELKMTTPEGKKKYISDYKIQDRSELFIVLRLPGGNESDSDKYTGNSRPLHMSNCHVAPRDVDENPIALDLELIAASFNVYRGYQ